MCTTVRFEEKIHVALRFLLFCFQLLLEGGRRCVRDRFFIMKVCTSGNRFFIIVVVPTTTTTTTSSYTSTRFFFINYHYLFITSTSTYNV